MQNKCPTKKPLQNRAQKVKEESDDEEERSDKEESDKEEEDKKDPKEETLKFLRKIGINSAALQEMIDEEDF